MPLSSSNPPLAYDDNGRGQPILFIHGYPLSRALWQPQLEALTTRARLIAPDLPGFGQSPPAQIGSLDDYASACAALLARLGIRQPVIVAGLSMGGYAALAFYRRFPEKVNGLILAATRASADSDEAKTNRDRAIALAQKEGAAAIVRAMLLKLLAEQTYTGRPGLAAGVRAMMLSASPEGITAALRAMRDRPDSTPMLAAIRVPTLILHGEQDQIMPASDAHTLREGIPASALVMLPNAGHLPNLEQPALFNQAILKFLDDHRSTFSVED